MRLAEGTAQPGHQPVIVEAFDGAHFRPVAGDRVGDAGAGDLAIDLDGAGAADAMLAADMRAGQQEMLAQEVGEMRARRDLGADRFAVHGEVHRRHDACAFSTARLSAAMWMFNS